MASDLISRDALLAEYDRVHVGEAGGARKLIAEATTIDAVEVVRCFECVKRGNSIECPMCHDAVFEDDSGDIEWYTFDNTNDEGFCHYGERRKEDGK